MTVATLEVPVYTVEQRAEWLEHVARMSNADHGLRDWRPDIVVLLLRAWCHPSLDDGVQLHLAWDDYLTAVRLRDDVDCGLVDWPHVDPELTCPDRQEAAFQIAAERADLALRVLLYGRRA